MKKGKVSLIFESFIIILSFFFFINSNIQYEINCGKINEEIPLIKDQVIKFFNLLFATK